MHQILILAAVLLPILAVGVVVMLVVLTKKVKPKTEETCEEE